MKYAERMVLIPHTEYVILKQTDTKAIKKKPNSKKGKAELVREMSKQIVAREKNALRVHKVSQDFKVSIVELLPPIYHMKAKLLLSELASAGITYATNRELVVNPGVVIPHSNIVDIIREALITDKKPVGTPKPVGWQDFINSVAASRVPKTIFKQSVRKEIERRQRVAGWETWD